MSGQEAPLTDTGLSDAHRSAEGRAGWHGKERGSADASAAPGARRGVGRGEGTAARSDFRLGRTLVAVLVAPLAVGLGITSLMFSDGTERMMTPGFILASTDSLRASMDYTVELPPGTTAARAFIWDYAAEDGDWVALRVGGTVLVEPFMITHAPREVSLPTGTTVEVVGVRDGGGGITYAINFPEATANSGIKMSVTNAAPLDGSNKYTLNVEPSNK